MTGDPTCVFGCDAALVRTLDSVLGPPIDSYVFGWQVWLHPDAGGADLEYRLHPPAAFRMPVGVSHHDLWDLVVTQLAEGNAPLHLGSERRTLDSVWSVLEVYPAYGDPRTPEEVQAAAEATLGRSALAAGTVDHDRLGARWKDAPGRYDLPGALLAELGVGG